MSSSSKLEVMLISVKGAVYSLLFNPPLWSLPREETCLTQQQTEEKHMDGHDPSLFLCPSLAQARRPVLACTQVCAACACEGGGQAIQPWPAALNRFSQSVQNLFRLVKSPLLISASFGPDPLKRDCLLFAGTLGIASICF